MWIVNSPGLKCADMVKIKDFESRSLHKTLFYLPVYIFSWLTFKRSVYVLYVDVDLFLSVSAFPRAAPFAQADESRPGGSFS